MIEKAKIAIKESLVSRGKNKGMLKAQCPKMGSEGAVAWQAIMSVANPFKIGLGHIIFMSNEHKELYNWIVSEIETKGIDVKNLDRDRKALEAFGIW